MDNISILERAIEQIPQLENYRLHMTDYNYAKNRHWIEALMECIDKK